MWNQPPVSYEPLSYSDFSCQSSFKPTFPSPCLLLGILAVIFVLMQRPSQHYGPHTMYSPYGLASMLSSAISARNSNPSQSSVQNLTNNNGDTEEEQAANDKSLRDYIKRNDKAIVIVFATWCPHCHTLIESLSQMDLKGRKILLVNGEAFHKTSFDGDNAICKIKYYPSIFLITNGSMEPKDSLSTVLGPDSSNETSMTDRDDEPEKDSSDTPDQLFAALF